MLRRSAKLYMYLKKTSLLVIAALGLAVPGSQAAPVINSAKVDLSINTITISGSGFGSVKPSVYQGPSPPLLVTAFSPTAIQAKFPVGVNTGITLGSSYALVVVSNSAPTSSGVFDVAVGDVGPQGPQGSNTG